MAEVARDGYGRPLIVPPDGGKAVPYTRCTTFVSALEDTNNLTLWKQRQTAIGLAQRPDLLLAVSAAAAQNAKSKLNAACEQAMQASGASAAANTGTALHTLTELVDRGVPAPIPPAARADVEAYKRVTAELSPVTIEQFVVQDELKVAGTPDRIVRYRDRLYVADLKTGSIAYGIAKIAMQLAVYSRSSYYDPATGQRSAPLADIDVDQTWGIVVHLPAGSGKAELVIVNIAAGWEGVQLARQVRDWRRRKNLSLPFEQWSANGTDNEQLELQA